ncbi:hypothetical protein AB0G29_12895 [Streptomyces parvus]|uniref:hypothetical protein n=1 Tax=Streptomyces parvus TaxID=66428 RepID=UPI0033E256D0
MAKGERYFYYEPADYMACPGHMGDALAGWFPETAERVGPSLWGDYDVDSLLPALLESGEVLKTQFRRIGTRFGPVENYCASLH